MYHIFITSRDTITVAEETLQRCTCTTATGNVVADKLRRLPYSPHGKRVPNSRLKVSNRDVVLRTGHNIHSITYQSIRCCWRRRIPYERQWIFCRADKRTYSHNPWRWNSHHFTLAEYISVHWWSMLLETRNVFIYRSFQIEKMNMAYIFTILLSDLSLSYFLYVS